MQEHERWPNTLTAHLNERGIPVELVCNPSVTGYTTQDLIDKELPVFEASKPDFATLLIGVNDWVQGVDPLLFRKNLTFIIEFMLVRLPSPERLIVITIPDFGVAPNGAQYARGRDISAGLSGFNTIVMEVAAEFDLAVVDIFPSSKKMATDMSLVWEDGVHPSALMYAEWETLILPVALEALSKSDV
jgi:lysophospholipase L1-like esterase